VAVHRILLGYYLNQKNLLDDMIFTQHALGDINANIYDTLPNFEDYKNLIPIFKQDQKCNVTDSAYAGVNLTPGKYVNLSDRYRAGKNMDFGHVMYSETYCNIVSESETEFVPYSLNRNIEIATEKTAKPFISKQVPLFLAGQGHLAYLKHLGFETMEDLMPPGYDQMRTLEKISAIVDVVAKGRDYIENFYFDHVREIQHNYDLAVSDTLEDKMVNDIRQLVG
jgi:hypothetical protein